MKKIILIVSSLLLTCGAFAEGYQVNNMSAKQTGMGHIGTAMKLNSESIFFNPAAASFQKSTFDISVGFAGILSSARYQALPSVENGYKIGQAEKSDNGLSTPIHAYFNYKPTKRLAIGLGFYTPDGSSMKWNDNWSGAHLIQNIDLKAFAFQPTISYRITKNFSIGAGLTINWGNFELNRSMFRMSASQELVNFLGNKIAQLPEAHPLRGKLAMIEQDLRTNYINQPLVSARLKGNANVAVGINAGFLWDINDEWSVGMTWRSRLDMKVKKGESSLKYDEQIGQYINMLGALAGGALPPIMNLDGGSFQTELPLPTSVTWGVSFRPTPRWEFGVDLQWVGWSAYDKLVVTFDESVGMDPIVSEKNYSNTLAFRFGGQFHATKFVTARMGMYVDQSPVDSNFLNPETPSMTKVSYTAGLSLRPSKCMSIDLSYCYVSTADPERIGSYPILNNATGKIEKFEGDYSLHANVFSVGMAFHF